MILESEMIHGCPARSHPAPQRPQPRPRLRVRLPGGAFRNRLPSSLTLAASASQGLLEKGSFPGEWDASAQLYEELQKSQAPAGAAPRRRARIQDDTPIEPYAVAEGICLEASDWLGEPFPQAWVAELAGRAGVIYAHNARFRRLLRKPGTAGRDWLAAFMRHWLYGLLNSRHPALAADLPAAYAAGHELPPPRPPRETSPV